jgi:hypothetical protein
MTRTYPLDTGFRMFLVGWGALCIAIVVGFPIGLILLWIAIHARVTIDDDRLVVRWLITRAATWDDIAGWRPLKASGFASFMAPIDCVLKGKPPIHVPLDAFARSAELRAELQRRLPEIPPPERRPIMVPTLVGVAVIVAVVETIWLLASYGVIRP